MYSHPSIELSARGSLSAVNTTKNCFNDPNQLSLHIIDRAGKPITNLQCKHTVHKPELIQSKTAGEYNSTTPRRLNIY